MPSTGKEPLNEIPSDTFEYFETSQELTEIGVIEIDSSQEANRITMQPTES